VQPHYRVKQLLWKLQFFTREFFGNTQIIMTNSPDLNPLDCHVWGAMHERYKIFQPKPNTIDKLKKVLQTIWDDLSQNSINKAALSFIKRLSTYVKAGGRHFEHVFKYLHGFELLASCDSLKCRISMFRLISIQAL